MDTTTIAAMRPPLADRVAIVTGASAGIGAAFARFLASQGAAVALVARRRDRLQTVAEELHAKHGVRTHVIAADLSQAEAARDIVEECTRALGPPDILVNNAGYGPHGSFADAPWEDHARFIHVMMTSYAELAHRVLPAMRARDWGRIVNVSSVAALAPEQRGSLYGPAKRFITSFSRALALEMEGTGVHVCAACPGFTYSEFHDVLGNRDAMSKVPSWMWTTAERVVHESWRAVDEGKPVVVIGGVNKLIAAVCWALPTGAVHAVSPKSVRERRAAKR